MINKVSKHIGNDPIRTDCNKCLCKDVCKKLDYYEYPWNDCKYFKDENHFIEVPCNINEPLYRIRAIYCLDCESDECPKSPKEIVEKEFEIAWLHTLNKQWGKTIFQTREEAEKAQKELTGKD